MITILLSIIFTVVAGDKLKDAAAKQLAIFKNNIKGPIGIMTTTTGAPVEHEQATCTLNTKLLSNQHLIELLTHAVRERIPERVLHAPGTGAFGYFEVTHDISHICKAKLFSKIGKITPVAARFSLTGPRNGARDTVRETSRGLAIKFYTEEGNFDLPGLNTPCFTFKDPLLFAQLSHVMKPNPKTNLADANMLWDFLSLNPEGMHQTLYLLSDYGYPRSYRHMAAYPIHTYQVYNAKCENWFVRFHLLPDAGIKNLNATEVANMAVGDPDYFSRDLHNAIANGDYPSWRLKVQILSEEDVKNADIDVFDVTNILPVDLYPLHPVGKVTLNRNAVSYFEEIEQLAVCPGNVVPGVKGGCDTLYEARRFTYAQAHLYRLGVNFNKISVNSPIQCKIFTYNQNGVPPVSDNRRGGPNYYPNSFHGAVPQKDACIPSPCKICEKESDNFKQASDFYAKDLNKAERNSLASNIAKSICSCEKIIKNRVVHWLTVINSDLGKNVVKYLKATCNE